MMARALILLALLVSCDTFSTRVPEDPSKSRSSFIPPTSHDIVIENLTNSVIELNLNNYLNCLADDTDLIFSYEASGEAYAQYANIFSNWNIRDEESYFNLMLSDIEQGSFPVLLWSESEFVQFPPDSFIYVSDYYLSLQHQRENLSKEFQGKARITIVPKTTGEWCIKRWVDTSKDKDTVLTTWSTLRGAFHN